MLSAGAAAAQNQDNLVVNCVVEAGVVGKYQIQYVTTGGVETATVPAALDVTDEQSMQINACIAEGSGQVAPAEPADRYIAFNVKAGPCMLGVFERGTEYCIRDASEVVLAR